MKVLIPTALRKHTAGLKTVTVNGDTIDEAIRSLIQQYPDLSDKLLDDSNQLASFVNVFVNNENIRDLQQTQTVLNDSDEILLVPAIAGG
ncbi:ubiquitin-like small modifier protein 1 [Stieleria varia]|uniref:Sulfur carrier protein CysO n=1 Tax=Stieleria varia TaxID=2528005 RepID=A0A5C6B5F1_9BACT|nr:ubiquitin-like small modifier protein 1 [Stieleria varia]TWU06496.1 Sulfur carrier protein CysO [Stieleria varia]